jgi:hypothetical protein
MLVPLIIAGLAVLLWLLVRLIRKRPGPSGRTASIYYWFALAYIAAGIVALGYMFGLVIQILTLLK